MAISATRFPRSFAVSRSEAIGPFSGPLSALDWAIARALYANPKILFLDEASAALDDATQADIMAALRHLSKNITIIAITHRASFIGKTDKVIKLG